MDKKFLIGGGAIAGVVIVAAVFMALSSTSPLRSGDNNDKRDVSPPVVQEGQEIKLTPEEMIRAAQTEMLKKYVFYKGSAITFEKQSWKSKGTDGSSGIGDATLTSVELLIYDLRTDRSYIIYRLMNYNSKHTVTVNDLRGKYIGTGNVSGEGSLTEYYGTGLLRRADLFDASASANPQYVLDFGMNPLRMNNGQKLIYTNPLPNKQDWVTYLSTAGNTSLGGARVWPPEERMTEILNLVPGLSKIIDSRGYNADETRVYEATGRFWVPVGTFSYNYRKMTYDEVKTEMEEIMKVVEQEDIYEELSKNLPHAWKVMAMFADDMGAIATGAQGTEAFIGYIISENYSDRGNMKVTLDMISDNQVLQENLDKLRKNIDTVRGDQGSTRQLNDVVIETSNDKKGGTEQKNLKKGHDAFMPLLNSLFLEYDSYQKALQKNIEEAKTYSKMKGSLPEDKVILLLKDFLKNAQSLKKINSYLNAMLTEIQIILTDLNGVKNADNEIRYRELNKLYGLWTQILNNYKSGQDVSIKVDVEKGVSLPEGYPVDVVKIIDGAIIAMSEIINVEGTTKKGFAVTLKTNLTTEEALQFYKNYLKNVPDISVFSVGGISTLSGNKGGYEFSIMILKNSLGGTEKTMLQIMLTPT